MRQLSPYWESQARAAEATLAALRGDEDKAEALARAAESQALPGRARAVLAEVQLARGLAALGGGRPGEAYEHFSRLLDRDDLVYHYVKSTWSIGDLADAAARSGHPDDIAGTIAELEALAARIPSAQLHVALMYARLLVAADADREALFIAGLRADLTDWPFTRARLQLALAHGFAGSGASLNRAGRCGRPGMHSTISVSCPGVSEPARSFARPARRALTGFPLRTNS